MRIALFTAGLLLLLGSALRAADDGVIYSDKFTALDPGWGEASEQKSVADGKLVLKPLANKSFTLLYQGNLFNDADIRVQIRQADGAADNTAGLVFWAADWSNFYVAQLMADGTMGVTRWMNGNQTNPVSYATQEALKKGVGQTNELRVVTVGRWAAVFINEKPVVVFKGFPPAGGSKIGVHAESGDKPYTWQFSDLVVHKPDPTLFPQASADANADPSVLFADDFSTFDPSWGAPGPSRHIDDGKLVMQPAPNTGTTCLYFGSLFTNADIRVKIVQTEGGTDIMAGVVFWASDLDNCYVAQLRSDGNVGVTRRLQNTQLNPVDYDAQDAMRKGIGQVNELRVVTFSNWAALYVNDQQIAIFQGFPPGAASKIGLHAESGDTPNTWQFSDLVVRKTDGALFPKDAAFPTNDAAVIFADDFVRLDPAWGEADGVQSVADHKLVVQPKPASAYLSIYQGNLFGDVDIRIKISETSGTPDQPGGLIFWGSDYSNFYVLQLSAGGGVGVSRFTNGNLLEPVSYTNRDAVKSGLGAVNELRVVLQGKSATFYVNDQQFATIKGFPPEQGGEIGIRAGSGEDAACTWQFSNLVVRSLQ